MARKRISDRVWEASIQNFDYFKSLGQKRLHKLVCLARTTLHGQNCAADKTDAGPALHPAVSL